MDRMSKAESSGEFYETKSVRHVLEVLQTHQCVILSSEPGKNMTNFSCHILSKLTKEDKKMLPVFISCLDQVWEAIKNASDLLIICCKPSKYDLYNDEILRSFFLKLEEHLKGGMNKSKIILIIDARCFQNVIRHYIRYDIFSISQIIDMASEHISEEDIHGVAKSLFTLYNSELCQDQIQDLLKFGRNGIYSAMESVLRQTDVQIDKLFHNRSNEAIVISILFLRGGHFSNESDCNQVNIAVSKHFAREQCITAEALSTSITELLHAKIVRWDDFETEFCFQNAFLKNCIVDSIIKSGLESLLITSGQLRQIDELESSGIFKNSSICYSLFLRIEEELRFASYEYVAEIFSLKIWENSNVQDALKQETSESVYFFQCLQQLDSRLHHRLIEIFVSKGSIFLFKYFVKEMKVNDTRHLTYLEASIKSGSVEICEFVLNYFQNEFDFDSMKLNHFVQLALESKSLQMIQFVIKLFSALNQSAIFSAIELGETQISIYLIEKGFDLSSTDDDKQTILHIVSKVSDPDLFSFVFRKTHSLINEKDINGLFPLYNAIQSGLIYHAALMCQEKGLDLSLCTADKESILHASVRSKSKSMVRYVIENTSDRTFIKQFYLKNKLGYTPIDLAVLLYDKDLVDCLLSRATNLKIKPSVGKGKTSFQTSISSSATLSDFPLNIPCYGPFYSLIIGFMQRVSDKFEYKTEKLCFSKWCLLSQQNFYLPQYQTLLREVSEFCVFLVETYDGFIPELLNVEDNQCMTPMSLAVCCNAENIISIFIENGANYLCLSKSKETLLQFIVRFGVTDIIKVLPNFPQWYVHSRDLKGFLAVDFLIKRSGKEIDLFLEYLCSQGLQCTDANGDTVFHRLARCDIAVEFGIDECRVMNHWITLSKAISKKWPNAKQCTNGKGNPPLFELVLNGRLDIVKYFLGLDVAIDEVGSGGRSLLHAAVLSNSVPIVHLIMDKAFHIINKPDRKRCTPVMLAVLLSYNDIATILIDKRCTLNNKNKKGMDVFDIALEMGNIEIAKKIVQAAPGINRWKPVDRLVIALSSQSEEMFQLFEFRYGIDSRNVDGETILHIAIKQRNIAAMVSILKIPDKEKPIIDKETIIVNNDDTPGISFAHWPLVAESSLLNRPTQFDNKSPLFISLETGFDTGCHTLLKSGAKLDIHTSNGQTIIHAAVIGVRKRKLDIHILIKIIKKKQELIDIPDVNDITPLFMEESLTDSSISRLLIKYGADFRRKYKRQKNIVHLLIEYKNFELIDGILEQDRRLALQEDDKGITPLHLYIIKCETEESFLLVNTCRDNFTYIRNYGLQICMLAFRHRRLKILTEIFGPVLKKNKRNDTTTLVKNIASLKPSKYLGKCIQIAMEHGNLQIIKELLNPEMEDYLDADGNTLLYYAVRSESIETVMYLHQRAPRLLTVKNYQGFNVLVKSLFEGNFSCTQYLVNYSKQNDYADILQRAVISTDDKLFYEVLRILKDLLSNESFQQIRDYEQNLPCFEAAKRGCTDKLKYLLAKGVNFFHGEYKSMNLIHVAVISTNLETVKEVIAHLNCGNYIFRFQQEALNKKTAEGKTPLFLAIELGLEDIVDFLLTLRPNLNATSNDGSTIMHAAIRHCHLRLIRRLCKLNFSLLNIQDDNKKTPLDYAILSRNTKVINRISRLSKSYQFISVYVFHIFEKAIRDKDITEAEFPLLLEEGFALHLIQNESKQSILHLCVLYENQTAMKMILEKSTKKLLDIQDEQDMTVLFHCVLEGNIDCVEMCLNSGANPNIPIDSSNAGTDISLWFTKYHSDLTYPIQVAVNDRNYNISKLLIDFNADTSMKGPNGENLLFLALARHDTGICKLLLKADNQLERGIYKRYLTPHLFEFFQNGIFNQVVMKRSSNWEQISMLLEILFLGMVQHLTVDFSRGDILFILLPVIAILYVINANFSISMIIIVFAFYIRKPCKDIYIRCLIYILTFICLWIYNCILYSGYVKFGPPRNLIR